MHVGGERDRVRGEPLRRGGLLEDDLRPGGGGAERGERPGELLRDLVGIPPGHHVREAYGDPAPATGRRDPRPVPGRVAPVPCRGWPPSSPCVSSLLWGSADFLGGTISRRRKAALVVGVSQAAGLVAIALVAALAGAWGDDTGYLPWAVLSGVAGVVGLVSFYAALAAGTMGVVSPIAALGVVVPVLVGLRPG